MMNERIRELADQCWDEFPNTGPVVFNKEKFAELIVEECAQRAEAYAYMSQNFVALSEELRRMKQHFGVEE
jgi:hypothetical protein